MASESVEAFLDLARSSRLLRPDVLDDLTKPGAPHDSLAALCDFLRDRGALTPYQAGLARAGKGDELSVGGYPITDEIGPCPGGTAFAAVHPSRRTPLVVRRLRADWLAPVDDPGSLIDRARAAIPVAHPNLARLLDVGVFRGEPFAVLEPFDGADLAALVGDIGPMPAVLAAGYARSAALGLAAAHEKGLTHGDVRPANVRVGPLVRMSKPRADGSPRFRPSAAATVQLTELGLVPRRPPAARWAADVPGLPPEAVAFLPPERLDEAAATPAGDVYGLGATLYFLLTGRPPYPGATAAEVVEAARTGWLTPLEDARRELPAELVAVVKDLMAADPAARPPAAAVADRLAPVAAPLPLPAVVPLAPAEPAAPPEPRPSGGWVAVPVADGDHPDGETFTPAAYPGWASEMFDPHAEPGPKPARRGAEGRDRLWTWVAVGAGLQVLAIVLWLVFFVVPGCSSEPEQPAKKQRK